MPHESSPPEVAYSVAEARELDRLASASFDLPGDLLMERAGRAAAALVRQAFPLAQRIAVVCGTGNNGGDGYVLARLLQEMRREVFVYAPEQALPRTGEAARACAAWRAAGGQMSVFNGALDEVDLVVDALFGIGLKRAPEGAHQALIAAINAQPAPVLALDVPSGLDADTGATPGLAVHAHTTLSFIGLKQGLLTGRAPDLVGDLLLDGLELPAVLHACVPPSVHVLRPGMLASLLPRRARSAHKGDFGHVLVVGGDEGYGGAVRLAAEAAARVGAGLVSIATRPQHVAGILAARPELMVRGVSGPGELEALLAKADVVVVGPGLGQGAWSQTLLSAVTERGLPTVMDADALNLLVQAACVLPERVVITPHPGEAARLLDCPTSEIQADRYGAVQRLAEFFQATAVLKGAGTLIAAGPQQPMAVCPIATPALASGGSGDVLAGCIGGLIAQGLAASDAARAAVLLHALAGLAAGADGERGTLAGDLLPPLRRLANP
ncbi:MAG: NAD(P)H-hydrate dehydratase [Xanthomonadales bacterium]|nr:Bifunctional NAD(P)H-hydrate repair enzyme Nnr [Xanthomonadales bacterium]MCC6592842.1 NAD(P)H-hydrate dehydratase [Xanthomonadales bacterium]MCE7930528.1 NAD(P)H-hydrate dehydratase [Xanthomonadales bacterium PRO6]